VSRRSKRRRGPHRPAGEDAAPPGRAAEPGREARGGRPGEGHRAERAAPPGSSRGAREAGRGGAQAGRGGTSARPGGAGAAADRASSGWGLGVQLVFLVAVFAVVVLVAELAGAANLGVALGVGQIAFAIAVIYLLLRR
jgi:hypothetical protein